MSAVQHLRKLLNERLTAAVGEILGIFEKTIWEYEQEIDRQRRLLAVLRQPIVRLRRIELPQLSVCQEKKKKGGEAFTEGRFREQGTNTGLGQQTSEPPQVKKEPSSGLQITQKADKCPLSSACEGQNKTNTQIVDSSHSAERNSEVNTSTQSPPESEPERIKQNSSQDSNNNSGLDWVNFYKCEICGKAFMLLSKLNSHIRSHRSMNSFTCRICGKSLSSLSTLKKHRIVHTGQKPHACTFCERGFISKSSLKKHLKSHASNRA